MKNGKIEINSLVCLMGKIENLQEIMKISKENNSKIICFDYKSDKIISKMNINHIIIDEVLNDDDYEAINKVALEIVQSWYLEKNINNMQIIEGINFGWLIEVEFYTYLFNKITLFLALLRIKEKFSFKTIYSSDSLSKYIKEILEEAIILTSNKEQIQKFRTDIFPIKFSIGPIPIMIKIKRKNFFRIVKYYEKILVPIFNIFSLKKDNRPEILLIDFNPTTYSNFLLELSKKNKILLLNRRRQAVHNLKSFKIVKKSKGEIISYNKIISIEDENKSKKILDEIKPKIQSIINLKEFDKFFSIENFNFANLIKNDFKQFYENRIKESINEIIGSRKVFESYNPKIILHHFAASLQEKIIIHEAKNYRIKDINFQHGAMSSDFNQAEKIVKFFGHFPIYYDSKYLSWGNISKELAVKNKIKEENILNLGCARFDDYFKAKNQNDEKDSIVFALGNISTINSHAQKITAYRNYEKIIESIANILKLIKNQKKILKIHPNVISFLSLDAIPIIKKIDPTIKIKVDLDLTNILNSAKVVILIQTSTFILESNLFDVPVITMLYDPQFDTSLKDVGYSKNFKLDEMKKFEKHLMDLLNNDKVRKKEIQKGRQAINDLLVNHGNASLKISEKISELIQDDVNNTK